MTKDQTSKAIMLVALLHNCQSLLDELPVKKEFKHKLKYSAKNFSNELDSFIFKFYDNIDDETNLEYNDRLKVFESYIDEILNGNVLVLNN